VSKARGDEGEDGEDRAGVKGAALYSLPSAEITASASVALKTLFDIGMVENIAIGEDRDGNSFFYRANFCQSASPYEE
jgi:hypothetical protein